MSGLGPLAYRLVDVFTEHPFAGNPLAVVLDADELTTTQMQKIALEFNLSETVFPVEATTPEANYRLRIFTPGTELPFAGHPSVGAAWVMRSVGRIVDGAIVQECGAGLLPLVIDGDAVTLTGGSPHLGEIVDPAQALAGVGLSEQDLVGDPMRLCGVGIDFAYLHVRPEALARTAPNYGAMRSLPGATGVFVFSATTALIRARMFAIGVGEDPATGSAALGLGVWLASCGRVAADGVTAYLVEQGVEMHRPSRLSCEVRCSGGVAVECRVTGSVVPVGEGHIRRP
ncbi:MAG TPA: PhzF family phenazine biosynthesis protein [Mycobacteriales bacterium]|nr:PhzF family phenazine biosynthesis protein [Mycobacteriales bacterium]